MIYKAQSDLAPDGPRRANRRAESGRILCMGPARPHRMDTGGHRNSLQRAHGSHTPLYVVTGPAVHWRGRRPSLAVVEVLAASARRGKGRGRRGAAGDIKADLGRVHRLGRRRGTAQAVAVRPLPKDLTGQAVQRLALCLCSGLQTFVKHIRDA